MIFYRPSFLFEHHLFNGGGVDQNIAVVSNGKYSKSYHKKQEEQTQQYLQDEMNNIHLMLVVI